MFGVHNQLASNEAKRIASEELGAANPELVKKLTEWLELVFQQWKIEHGNRSPTGSGGLLGGDPILFEDAEPWQCAGLITQNRIELALKLWEENYQPYLSLLDKVPLNKVLAVLILNEPDSTMGDSQLRAANIIRDIDRAVLRDIVIRRFPKRATSRDGIKRKDFTEKYRLNIKGREMALNKFLDDGKRKGQMRRGNEFQISHGQYDEERLVQALKDGGIWRDTQPKAASKIPNWNKRNFGIR
jgi:hypothetical protein